MTRLRIVNLSLLLLVVVGFALYPHWVRWCAGREAEPEPAFKLHDCRTQGHRWRECTLAETRFSPSLSYAPGIGFETCVICQSCRTRPADPCEPVDALDTNDPDKTISIDPSAWYPGEIPTPERKYLDDDGEIFLFSQPRLPPSVVVFSYDDPNHHLVGMVGEPNELTPYIDRLCDPNTQELVVRRWAETGVLCRVLGHYWVLDNSVSPRSAVSICRVCRCDWVEADE